MAEEKTPSPESEASAGAVEPAKPEAKEPSEAPKAEVTTAEATKPTPSPAAEPVGEKKPADKGPKEKKPEDKKNAEKQSSEDNGQASESAPADTGPTEPKKRKRPGGSPRRGKKLRKSMKTVRDKIEKAGSKTLEEAVEVLRKHKRAKFDETVEIHMSLGVDVSQADQIVRGTVSLPHGIGKSVRVLVFCQGENQAKAQEAGADFVGDDDLIKKVQGGWTDFDVALATHDMMGKVGRLGKILGPRGLMPTPKAGTVVTGDVAEAITEFKAGKVEYRTDKTGNVHAGVGKMSFDTEKLVENIRTFVNQIRSVKPSSVKGHYIQSIYVSATQSPSVPVNA